MKKEITWNSKELLKFCPKNITDRGKIYVEGIGRKIERILFLVEKLNDYKNIIPIQSQEQFLSVQLETEIYLESIAYNLHSLSDVMAQIIYVFIIEQQGLELNARDITLHKIKDKLNCLISNGSVEDYIKIYLQEMSNSIHLFYNSSEYKYINALVNTIKHRHLIDTKYQLNIQQTHIKYSDFKFINFNKDEIDYPEVDCSTLISKYRETILNHVFEMGNIINNYSRACHIANYK